MRAYTYWEIGCSSTVFIFPSNKLRYHVVDWDEGIVDDLDVEAGLDGRPQDEPPDLLEAVDPDLGRQHLARRRRSPLLLRGAKTVLRHFFWGRLRPLDDVLSVVYKKMAKFDPLLISLLLIWRNISIMTMTL